MRFDIIVAPSSLYRQFHRHIHEVSSLPEGLQRNDFYTSVLHDVIVLRDVNSIAGSQKSRMTSEMLHYVRVLYDFRIVTGSQISCMTSEMLHYVRTVWFLPCLSNFLSTFSPLDFISTKLDNFSYHQTSFPLSLLSTFLPSNFSTNCCPLFQHPILFPVSLLSIYLCKDPFC